VLGTGQRPDAMIATMSIHDAVKGLPWQEVHDLGEQGLADIHRNLQQES